MDEEVDSFMDDNWNAGMYKQSTQETGQLNRMKQSSLGLLDFLGVPISPFITFHRQFPIYHKGKIVQRLFRKGKKKKAHFRLEIIF
jgi:hypothetical protein